MWMIIKVNGHLEGFEGGVNGCSRVEFCFMIHCGHLGETEHKWTARVITKTMCWVKSLLWCSLCPCRARVWCMDNF